MRGDSNRVKKLFAGFFVLVFILSSCAERAEEKNKLSESLADISDARYTASITAVFPEREASFTIDYTYNEESELASVAEPAEVRGVSYRIEKDSGTLLFDGASLDIGRLDDFGTSPFSCLSCLIKSWKAGEFSEMTKSDIFGKDAILTVTKDGNIEYRTWFSKDNFLPLYAEVFSEGRRVIQCKFERAEHRRE